MGKAITTSNGGRPGDDPLVMTPGGWRPKSKVHFVEPGHHISGKDGRLQKIHTASGKMVADYGTVSNRKWEKRGPGAPQAPGAPHAPGAPGTRAPFPDDGWIVDCGWSNTSSDAISYMSTEWVVPPPPTTDVGQTIYLFNGLEQSGSGGSPEGPFILQPVLQWGPSEAGGGSYWSITNWYAGGPGDPALYGTLVQVNPGDSLQGIMTLTSQSGTNFNYTSVFAGQSAADLTVTDIAELTWACETLECYGITQPSDYPATLMTAMTNIEVKVGTAEASLDWSVLNSFTDNGQQCLVISNASPGGDVYLFYATDTQNFYFVVDKSSFGKDEVSDVIASAAAGKFSNAFWLVLDGYTPNWIAGATPTFAGASTFKSPNVNGLSIAPDPTTPVEYELGGPGTAYADTVQRIRFAYDVTFSSVSSFPAIGSDNTYTLLANISIAGTTLALEPETIFQLLGGSDPYFTNVDSGNPQSVFYLSQDLRVFTVNAGESPVSGAPAFSSDPYGSIQSFLYYLNNTDLYTQTYPPGADPLNALPDQTGYETGDTSVTPLNGSNPNYNFAIARVRLQGATGTTSPNTRVFFRLWVAVSTDTDFQPGTTYLSTLGSSGEDSGLPVFPLASGPLTDPSGNTLQTIPFFATDATGSNDYNASYVPASPDEMNNIQTITVPAGEDTVYAYFGCFLNVYDASYNSLFPGTHHCIVAQIAYDDAPIPTTTPTGATPSPENWDKLAQRNLQITSSGNPGFPVTHRIPQTFDARPSPLPALDGNGALLNYPDEFMIDWGNTPVGSIASIFWPQVSSAQVLAIAAKLYPTHLLSAADNNTIQCTVTGEVTYVPIPDGAGQNLNLAGLFTVDLPDGIKAGNEFNITVRRIVSKQVATQGIIPAANKGGGAATHGGGNSSGVDRKKLLNWRCIAGTFQVRIPVSHEAPLLKPEENVLAILKWRLQNMAAVNRWYPVLQRYISYVSSRVKGMGGNPSTIQPSQWGLGQPGKTGGQGTGGHGGRGGGFGGQGGTGGLPLHGLEFTGKVSAIIFDRFGDFDGFLLLTLEGHERAFRGREPEIEELVNRAWTERILISVFVEKDCKHIPVSIVYRRF